MPADPEPLSGTAASQVGELRTKFTTDVSLTSNVSGISQRRNSRLETLLQQFGAVAADDLASPSTRSVERDHGRRRASGEQGVMISQLAGVRRETSRLQAELAANESALSFTRADLALAQDQAQRAMSAEAQLKTLQQQVSELSTPQLGGAVVDLGPGPGTVVRGTAEAQVITTSSDATPATIVLNHEELLSRSTLEVVIQTNDTRQVRWTGRVVQSKTPQRLPSCCQAGIRPAGMSFDCST